MDDAITGDLPVAETNPLIAASAPVAQPVRPRNTIPVNVRPQRVIRQEIA